MVKIVFAALSLFFINKSHADFSLGIATTSWQEFVPTLIQTVDTSVLTTFSSFGISFGYKHKYTTRLYSTSLLSYNSGTADIHKQPNALTPRLKFTSFWLSNKIMWRSTKTFALGPNFVISNRTLESAQSVTSFGLFFDFDFDIFNATQLTQSIGSISDSKQLAYSLSLNRLF